MTMKAQNLTPQSPHQSHTPLPESIANEFPQTGSAKALDNVCKPKFTSGQKTVKNNNLFSIITLIIVTILGIALFIWFDMDEISAFIEAYPSWVILISLFAFAILGFTIIPSTPLSILLAALMGPWQAVLWGTVGMTLSSLIEYFVARQFCDAFDIENWRQKLPKRWRDLPLDSLILLIFGRFFPGPKVIALGAATLRLSMFRYICTSFVSNLLGNAIIILFFTGILKRP